MSTMEKKNLLILSTCGLLGEQEDPKFLNLYLSSLKKNIIPHFETTVILFDTSNNKNPEEGKTYEKIKSFELENEIKLKNLYTVNLPEESIKFFEETGWFARVGLTMNLLFEYAKMNNFFEADWLFHSDTDVEFFPNFSENFKNIISLKENMNVKTMITVSGDSYPTHVQYENLRYIIGPPKKFNPYNVEELNYHFHEPDVLIETVEELYDPGKIVIKNAQQKIRNDFFIISRDVFESEIDLNWANFHFISGHFDAKNENLSKLEEIFKNKNEFMVSFGWDKGEAISYKNREGVDFGYSDTLEVQVPNNFMTSHYASGWTQPDYFHEVSLNRLKEYYVEYENIWKNDYEGI